MTLTEIELVFKKDKDIKLHRTKTGFTIQTKNEIFEITPERFKKTLSYSGEIQIDKPWGEETIIFLNLYSDTFVKIVYSLRKIAEEEKPEAKMEDTLEEIKNQLISNEDNIKNGKITVEQALFKTNRLIIDLVAAIMSQKD